MKPLQLSLLSKFRKELMGISAIMILICHIPGNGIRMPKVLEYVLAQGQIGVDIFLFLSGMGLWYSLSKSSVISGGGVKYWYINRYTKILVPYIIIQGVMTAVRCYEDDSLGLLFWISSVSTVEFWLSHRAAWFIALLLPLYLIAPWLYRFFKSKVALKFTALIIAVYLIGLLPLDWIEMKVDNNNILYNIQFALWRVPSFIFGMYMAPYIKQNRKMKKAWLIPMLIAAVCMLVLTRHSVHAYLFLVLPVMYVLAMIFHSETGLFNKLCRFYGQISLESYLWNGLSIVFIPLMAWLGIPDYNNMVMYSLVILCGTLLSVGVSKMKRPIIAKLTK